MELPCALLRGLASSVCLPSLLDGLGAGLPRGRQRRLNLGIFKIALMACKADGYHQLAPFLSKAQAFGLKACILTSKLRAKLAHCISRPLKKLLAKGAALPSVPGHVSGVILRCW